MILVFLAGATLGTILGLTIPIFIGAGPWTWPLAITASIISGLAGYYGTTTIYDFCSAVNN